MDYDSDSLAEQEILDPDQLRPYSKTSRKTWIDIQGLGDEDKLRAVAAIFGIHEVALADAVNIPQRAKTQDYIDHILVVVRTPRDPFDVTETIPQVCILLAGNYIVTFQERYFAFFDEVRARLRDDGSMLRRSGPSLLAYALTDVLVDRFYPIVEEISEQLDELEVRILEKPSPDLVSHLHRLQRQITTLRRVARPQVEALYRLAHSDSPLVPSESAVFLKDVEDHARQILGRLDACRDIATDTMGAVLATLGHRQNEVMKVLTLVGSIFIPLTFMAGIYGMNFEYMPELKIKAAYPTLLGAMVVVAVGMVWLFRSRGWIGGGPRRK
jgi:magnesium transporter